MLPVAVLAGGLGTRLRPVTEKIPKCMIEIEGQPFIAHQIRLLKESGFDRLILCIGYLGESIRQFVGDGERFGLEVEYSEDGPQFLGTAGAIRNALPLLRDEFLVLYGDSYLPCDYEAIVKTFLQSRAPALMTVFRNRNRWERSNIHFHDGCIRAYDKRNPTGQMEYVDYGLSAFRSFVFDEACPRAQADLGSVFQGLIQRRELAGFEVEQRFHEIGSWEGIRRFASHLAAKRTAASQKLSGAV